jgi:hypothetical protein
MRKGTPHPPFLCPPLSAPLFCAKSTAHWRGATRCVVFQSTLVVIGLRVSKFHAAVPVNDFHAHLFVLCGLLVRFNSLHSPFLALLLSQGRRPENLAHRFFGEAGEDLQELEEQMVRVVQ